MGPAAATTLLVVGCGFVLARGMLRGSPGPTCWLEPLAWAPAVGFGLLSLIFFAWRIGRVPGFGRGSLAVLTASAILVLVLDRRREGSGRRGERPGAEGSTRLPALFRWGSRVVLGVTAAGLGVAFHRWSSRWPLGTADAINIWNVRARFLHFADQDVGELFHMMKRGHPDYPLLLPGSLAGQAGFWGGWDQALPQATGAVFLLGLGLMTHFALRRLGSAHLAAAGAALVLASPPVWRWAFSQGADLPLSYLTLAAGIGLASHLEPSIERPVPPILAGFVLSLLPWTKNEGVLLAGALGTIFVLTRAFHPEARRAGSRTTLAIIAGALPGLVALAAFKISWAPPSAVGLWFADSMAAKLVDSGRWRSVLSTAATTVDPLAPSASWRWILVALVLAVVIFCSTRAVKRPSLTFLIGSLVLAILGYLVAYVLSPYELAWHVTRSLDRLLLQLLPLAVVWALALAAPSGAVAPGADGPGAEAGPVTGCSPGP